jgi:hypothetical protein
MIKSSQREKTSYLYQRKIDCRSVDFSGLEPLLGIGGKGNGREDRPDGVSEGMTFLGESTADGSKRAVRH